MQFSVYMNIETCRLGGGGGGGGSHQVGIFSKLIQQVLNENVEIHFKLSKDRSN